MAIEEFAQRQLDTARKLLDIVQQRQAQAEGDLESLLRVFGQADKTNAAVFENALMKNLDEVARGKNRVALAEALVAKREQEWKDCKR